MFDNETIEQLKSVFAQLESEITLLYTNSTHADQAELLEMLQAVATTSPKIRLQSSPTQSANPQFQILKNNVPTRIKFTGIPGGHEFTSLILAILNSDNKGKMPDSLLTERIRKLKGPIKLKTFISLSCENCPDVVQGLNQMALINDQFEHEMIDGKYAADEIKNLNIQGVPSVVSNEELIHSGRSHFLDLLTKLESHFGLSEESSSQQSFDLGHFDVVVIGGGPAGAAAAIYSARKGLKTTIISETIGGQVQETKGIENLISVVYTEGPQLAGQLAQHIRSYPIKILEHRRVKTITPEHPKRIELESGEFLSADAVIVSTGAKWRELGIPGEKEYIGRGVAFCPHCDGPYYKGKDIAVVGGGNSGVEAAIDLSGIVNKVTLVEFQNTLKADKVLVDKLKSLPNVQIITSAKTTAIEGDGNKVVSLHYLDRETNTDKTVKLDGVFVQIGLLPNSRFLNGLVETTQFGEIIIDPKNRTSVRGIYAAGDVTTTPYKQIVIAMGEGAKAALAAFEDRMHHS